MNRPPLPIRIAPWPPLRAATAVALLVGAWSLPLAAQQAVDGATAESVSASAGPGQSTATPGPVPAARPGRVPSAAGPQWSALSAEHRAALAPLAPHWNGLSENHKRKWMAMTRDFRNLSPEEQTRMHGRMASWAALSPRQRAEARFNFAAAQERLSPDTRKARWESYQALSSDEKQRLAASAPPASSKGAATPAHVPAAAPVPVRLVAPPAVAARAKASSVSPAVQHARIQHNTLLPERAVPGMPVQAPRAGTAP